MAAAYVGSDGDREAFKAFAKWSALSSKYNPRRTWQRWKAFDRKPPRDIGPGTLYAHANATAPGWRETMLEAALAMLKEQYAAAMVAATAKGKTEGGRDA